MVGVNWERSLKMAELEMDINKINYLVGRLNKLEDRYCLENSVVLKEIARDLGSIV